MKYIPEATSDQLDEALQHIKSIDAKIESSEGINWGLHAKGDDT
jgi:hypothetical protein